MSHLLEVEGLTTVFTGDYGETTSVDHVSFHVDEGEVVCIVGESGCGKSVTNLSVMGLLSRGGKVTEGKVLFEDRDLLAMSEKELDKIRGDQMTMIFQDPLTSLNPVFTVGNQIMESLQIHRGLSRNEAGIQAEELLSKVGMPDAKGTMKKYPHTLSGGMRQRAMIAMALSCKPKLLIADEPTTALDVTIQDEFGPYLYANQYVNFTAQSKTVAKAVELSSSANDDLEVIENVYNYIITNFTYDYDKAASVQGGYLPDVDDVLAKQTGICFDYAAVMAAMLRCERIPTRLEVGYMGDVYHAWISTYIKDKGWVNGIIEFDGNDWKLMDPTFASTSSDPKDFLTQTDEYITKYVY